MVNVQEMLIEDVKEETKGKIDKENDSPYLTGISRGDDKIRWSSLIATFFVFIYLFYF
jgi:hypothetical protein